ncbi:MAG: 4-alpha-glucanotransferase [Myxococcota bacterium]
MNEVRGPLEKLADLYGVEVGYHDIEGKWHGASNEQLLHVLELLGAPLRGFDDVVDAVRDREWHLGTRVLEPVQVIWQSAAPQLTLHLHERAAFGPYAIRLRFEEGQTLEEQGRLEELKLVGRVEVDGRTFVKLALPLGLRPPLGYHRATLTLGRLEAHSLIVCAPEQTYAPEGERQWGLFAPTYALRTNTDRGVGHLGHLRRLADRIARAGGQVVGTLPLLAAFLDFPYEPSPYVPVTRRFFNELYLDLARLPEIRAPKPAERFGSSAFEQEAAALRDSPFADAGRAYHLIQPVLAACAEAAASSDVRAEIDAWARQHPRVWEYARFRARTTQRQQVWHLWPDRDTWGGLEPESEAEAEHAFRHVYAQFRLQQQLEDLGSSLAVNDGGLYLDVPLGVHPDGYDAWADRNVFVEGLSAGAPPDGLAPEGQDWGFRPVHPIALRESGYAYFIETLRQQARIASVLRIDHVMGLHRIFTVPWAFGAVGGTYVRQPADELWAIVCLESQRSRCRVVGEDLGTVPPEVRERMHRHRAQRMYVAQFEIEPHAHDALRPIPSHAAVSVNTHDTPTFMGFWEHRDIEERRERGVVSADGARWEHEQRRIRRDCLTQTLLERGRVGPDPGPMDVLVGLLTELAESEAPLLLVNAEDLWLEAGPQNVPGTSTERPNWRRRMQLDLNHIEQGREVSELLSTLAQLRARGS